ncbi:MAG: hypothetical protein WD602_02365 [Actinomycetota bacterium]
MSELTGATLAAGFFVFWLLLVETASRRKILGPEAGRKALHLGGGLGCLAFPLLVESPITVLLLALGFASVFAWGERGALACLSRVSRHSRGGIYFPFAVAGVFWLTADRPGLYLASMLVLTLSDAAAALAGARFGRFHFRVGGVAEHKSLEGSFMFFVISLLAIILPLRLLDGLDLPHAFLAALLTATLLTGVEAVSIAGRDNLYVPMAAAFILLKVVSKPVPELLLQTFSLLALFTLVFLFNRRMLRTQALVTIFLMVYAVWALGSIDWAVPLLTASAAFAVCFEKTGATQRATRVYRRMTLLAAPAVTTVLIANLTGIFSFAFAPYLAAILVPLLWGVQRQGTAHADEALPTLAPRRLLLMFLIGLAVLAFPLFRGLHPDPMAVLILTATVGITLWLGWKANTRLPTFRGGRGVLFTTLATMLILAGLQTNRCLACWRPGLWADQYDREADVLFPLQAHWLQHIGGPECN